MSRKPILHPVCMSTYKVQLTENTTQRFVNELFTEIRLDLIFTR
jgi:hypothetical protein